MSLSSFRFEQNGVPGGWDLARRDITLFSVGGEVTGKAKEASQTSYLWEIISAPDGVSVTVRTSTTNTCTFDIVERGSYLLRLTVNAGLPNQSITTLFFGVPMEGSALCYPALNETRQDNSQSPYTGVRGVEEKLDKIYKWNERRNSAWVREKAADYTITEADDGLTFVPTVDGVKFQMPACRNGFRATIVCPPGVSAEVDRAGSDKIIGGWTAVTGNQWNKAGVGAFSRVEFEGIDVDGTVSWHCRGEGRVFDIDSSEVWYFGTGHADVSGSAGIYVDATFGSDVFGDGTPEMPYQTLVYAATQQAAPTTMKEFVTPIEFFLAPGVYSGKVVLPERLSIKIVGDLCKISGDIDWPLNPEHWFTWSLTQTPTLSISRREKNWGVEGWSTTCDVDYPNSFVLEGGTLRAYNSNPGLGYELPLDHHLYISGAVRAGFNIYNEPSGTVDYRDAIGNMALLLDDSMVDLMHPSGASWVCGEADRGSGDFYPNHVNVKAVGSMVFMRGVCKITSIKNCYFHADRTIDHTGSAYDYGAIDSSPSEIDNYESIVSSYPFDVCYFGFDPAAPAPVFSDKPNAIVFDRVSLLALAAATMVGAEILANCFYGFSTTSYLSAYGRGWYMGGAEWVGNKAVTRIPSSDKLFTYPGENPSGSLFEHVYACATDWLPNGATRTMANPLTIELEPGSYGLTGDLEMNIEHVHVVGMGSSMASVVAPPTSTPRVYPSDVQIYVGNYELVWNAESGRLERLDIQGYGDSYAGKFCMKIAHSAQYSVFKDLTFTKFKYDLWAVLIDPGLAPAGVMARWENCHTLLNGFLYGGNIAGTCVRCSAGDYSFAGWSGASVIDVGCGGYLVDCVATKRSFGAIYCTDPAGGGTASFNGTAERCRVGTQGFGYCSTNIAVVGDANCSGVLVDCDNYLTGGSQSFGFSGTGTAFVNATFLRCTSGDYSFGRSNAAAYTATFQGQAKDCMTGKGCFGSNGGDPTKGIFQGVMERCSCGIQSCGHGGYAVGTIRSSVIGAGSLGNPTSQRALRLFDVEVTDITGAVGGEPVRLWGAKCFKCRFIGKVGYDTEAVRITGGVGASDATRLYDCDIWNALTATSPPVEAASANTQAQVAHCRMNRDLSTNVVNLIGSPYNVVDVNYDPGL